MLERIWLKHLYDTVFHPNWGFFLGRCDRCNEGQDPKNLPLLKMTGFWRKMGELQLNAMSKMPPALKPDDYWLLGGCSQLVVLAE